MAVTTLSVSEIRAEAMGSTVHLLVTGHVDLVLVLDRAMAMIEDLEAKWSRFRPSSEIAQLNTTAAGEPVAVSPETLLLVESAVEAWRRSAGLFDPTLLRAVVAAGYDRDFGTVAQRPLVAIAPGPTGRCDGIIADPTAGTVTMPADVGFDPGGLGKGLAADLVAEAALTWGADGVMVNLGGDLRCTGAPPPTGSWMIEAQGRLIEIGSGGVATSTCLRRRWETDRGMAHHLIDPTTGRPSPNAADAVTVLAATACDAETLATAIATRGRLPIDRNMFGGAAVLVTRHDGTVESHGPIDRYLR